MVTNWRVYKLKSQLHYPFSSVNIRQSANYVPGELSGVWPSSFKIINVESFPFYKHAHSHVPLPTLSMISADTVCVPAFKGCSVRLYLQLAYESALKRIYSYGSYGWYMNKCKSFLTTKILLVQLNIFTYAVLWWSPVNQSTDLHCTIMQQYRKMLI